MKTALSILLLIASIAVFALLEGSSTSLAIGDGSAAQLSWQLRLLSWLKIDPFLFPHWIWEVPPSAHFTVSVLIYLGLASALFAFSIALGGNRDYLLNFFISLSLGLCLSSFDTSFAAIYLCSSYFYLLFNVISSERLRLLPLIILALFLGLRAQASLQDLAPVVLILSALYFSFDRDKRGNPFLFMCCALPMIFIWESQEGSRNPITKLDFPSDASFSSSSLAEPLVNIWGYRGSALFDLAELSTILIALCIIVFLLEGTQRRARRLALLGIAIFSLLQLLLPVEARSVLPFRVLAKLLPNSYLFPFELLTLLVLSVFLSMDALKDSRRILGPWIAICLLLIHQVIFAFPPLKPERDTISPVAFLKLEDLSFQDSFFRALESKRVIRAKNFSIEPSERGVRLSLLKRKQLGAFTIISRNPASEGTLKIFSCNGDELLVQNESQLHRRRDHKGEQYFAKNILVSLLDLNGDRSCVELSLAGGKSDLEFEKVWFKKQRGLLADSNL